MWTCHCGYAGGGTSCDRLEFDERRQLLLLLIERIEIDEDKTVRIVWHPPFGYLHSMWCALCVGDNDVAEPEMCVVKHVEHGIPSSSGVLSDTPDRTRTCAYRT